LGLEATSGGRRLPALFLLLRVQNRFVEPNFESKRRVHSAITIAFIRQRQPRRDFGRSQNNRIIFPPSQFLGFEDPKGGKSGG